MESLFTNMKRKGNWTRLAAALMVPLLSCGCLSQWSGVLDSSYKKYYVPNENSMELQFLPEKDVEPGPLEVKGFLKYEDVNEAQRNGWILLGSSRFEGTHAPMVIALEQAEDVGADLVLIRERYSRIVTNTVWRTVATTSSFGTVMGSYGSGANYYGLSSVSAPVEAHTIVYLQEAFYLRKGDHSGFYGVFFHIPKRQPDEKRDDEIPVYVEMVLHGSQAEKEGLKKGQRVLSINGERMVTRNDIRKFLENPRTIRKVEVMP